MKNSGPSCLRYVFVFFTRSNWLWVCLPRAPSNNWLSYFLFPLTGRSPYFRSRVPANRLASTFLPPWSGDFVRATRYHPSQVTEYKHLLVFTPTYILSLWFVTVHSDGRIVLILFLSSPWDITWHNSFSDFIFLKSFSKFLGIDARVSTMVSVSHLHVSLL